MPRGTSTSDEDPLTAALAPPSDETPEQREFREKREAEAKRISDEIDEQLRNERAALRKKKIVKVLLLGQSESGMLQLLYSLPGYLSVSVYREIYDAQE
jgi:guanine nucleotide-binding protein alpha-1 subunit